MHFKTILIITAYLVMAAHSVTANDSQVQIPDFEAMQELIQQHLGTISMPSGNESSPAQQAAAQAAEKLRSVETQAAIAAESKRLAGKLGPGGPAQESSCAAAEAGKIYVLVSESVPVETLRAYAADLEKLDNATFVLRGFVGGMKLFGPTRDFVTRVLRKAGSNDSFNAAFEINPDLFRKNGISQVPAVIYVNTADTFILLGDTPLHVAVQRIMDASGDQSLAVELKKIIRQGRIL